jgi:hypothetical protein
MRPLVALTVLVLATACDDPSCVVVPGPNVEAGSYQFQDFYIPPALENMSALPYVDAADLRIELSSDRSEAIIRYIRDGALVEEHWSVEILG